MNNNNQNPVDPQVAQGQVQDAQAQVNPVNNQQQINANVNMQQNAMAYNPYINANQNQMPMNQGGLQNNPYINTQADVNPADSGFTSGDFIKGALIGAGVAFLLTNKSSQQAIFNGFSKGSELVQAGIEELKERMEDAKAQMEAKEF